MGQAHVHTWKLNQNISTGMAIFLNQKRANVCEISLHPLFSKPLGGTFHKMSSDAIFVVFSEFDLCSS